MLTAAQRPIRATGIGASEISAVLEMNPYRGPIDVWLEKTGRAEGGPEDDTISETTIGHHLEAFALALYSKRTGHKLFRPKVTLRHPEHEHMLASPDALGRHDDLGAEAKIVGWRMAHHWAGDTLPDYVDLQARQNMAVTGRAAWDVVALIGGTDVRIHRVERDLDIEAMLAESCEGFWRDHVANDVPPPVQDPSERRRYLLTRYPGSEATTTRWTPDPTVAAAVGRIRELDEVAKELEAERDELADLVAEIIGGDYGIEGPWGKALWYPTAGPVRWKELAEKLAGGVVPPAVIEEHRGKGTRTFRVYGPKKSSTRKARTR